MQRDKDVKEIGGLLMDLYTVMRTHCDPSIEDFYKIAEELGYRFASSKGTLRLSILHIVELFHKTKKT